ncbi:polysaccharide deacetylase family protein [Flavobacterium humi]|uniref:Polysaccharide deacetylase family protein n=1 Tax=Flavobacterium humi TaxID=2562683 RepID=A0A4Z0L5Q9_9FLAO|nr:polysaccharide deacetylase family protein [Flavobacterium humi]TGD57303.1 polysaccharide deacetylase family protein [Flavobacterium humi]
MDFYWIKTPGIIKRLFSNQVWDIPNTCNKIYLTFDDGPTPEATQWILDTLKENGVLATFFCIGHNIEKHPEIFDKIIAEGHAIGNHTFNHLQGWKTRTKDYLENIARCEERISAKISPANGNSTQREKLFRPPYGKIKPAQSRKLQGLGYKIIMWDVLTADFDRNVSPEKCLENATQKVTPGSIIVFHDSIKTFKNTRYALPETIKMLKEKGFVFDVIG